MPRGPNRVVRHHAPRRRSAMPGKGSVAPYRTSLCACRLPTPAARQALRRPGGRLSDAGRRRCGPVARGGPRPGLRDARGGGVRRRPDWVPHGHPCAAPRRRLGVRDGSRPRASTWPGNGGRCRSTVEREPVEQVRQYRRQQARRLAKTPWIGIISGARGPIKLSMTSGSARHLERDAGHHGGGLHKDAHPHGAWCSRKGVHRGTHARLALRAPCATWCCRRRCIWGAWRPTAGRSPRHRQVAANLRGVPTGMIKLVFNPLSLRTFRCSAWARTGTRRPPPFERRPLLPALHGQHPASLNGWCCQKMSIVRPD